MSCAGRNLPLKLSTYAFWLGNRPLPFFPLCRPVPVVYVYLLHNYCTVGRG